MLIVIIVVLTLRRQKLEAISERDKAERYAAEADAKSRELKETFDQLDEEHKHRERLQAKNAELQEENQTAARQLIQADKLATLGTLVAGVAHDIANPTGLIQGALTSTGEIRTEIRATIRELLSDDSEEAKALLGQFESQFTNQESAAKDIALAAARIGEINSAIRNQSRVDLAPGIVTLRTLVDECLTITRSRLIGIEVELCFEEKHGCAGDSLTVRAGLDQPHLKCGRCHRRSPRAGQEWSDQAFREELRTKRCKNSRLRTVVRVYRRMRVKKSRTLFYNKGSGQRNRAWNAHCLANSRPPWALFVD